ncbi:MAG: cardiolipin synthase [Planctomycetota bacterium]
MGVLPTISFDSWYLILWSLFGVLMHLAALGLIVHVLMRGRSPQGTIAWIIALALWPTIFVWLYLLVGFRKFHGYTHARRVGREPINALGASLRERAESGGLVVRPADPDLHTISDLARLPAIAGNSSRLLIDGQATFDSLMTGIAAARCSVVVQFYIIRDDSIGRRLSETLCERARAGVHCLLLYDEIGSYQLPRSWLDHLATAGVKIAAFNTRRGRLLNRLRVNFRNHRKIVVVDGREAWTGGLNIGDEYAGRSSLGPWRDTHLHISGPAALACQLSFAEDWYFATGTVPGLAWDMDVFDPDAGDEMLVIPTGPADTFDTALLLYLQVIAHARERLWIASPYFVPDSAITAALQLAALRGVDVRILLPANPDHLLIWLASHSFLEELCTAGVRFFRYRNGFMHQKVALIDDRFSLVGTANLDNRSLRINFEITICRYDPASVAATEAMLAEDLTRCYEIDASAYHDRGFPFRLAARAASLCAPLL